MPSWKRPDDKPVVEFDPRIEISPFTLYRRLREARGPLLVDVRSEPREWTLTGATRWPGEGWEPPNDRDVLLFDDDQREAMPVLQALREAGFERVRRLFGGMELYVFSLDAEVVGEETYLRRVGA